MAPRTIVYQHITNFNGFFLPTQLQDWECDVSNSLLQQSVRFVSEPRSKAAWEGHWLHGPLLSPRPHLRGDPILESRRGYGSALLRFQMQGCERPGLQGALQSTLLWLPGARQQESFGSLNGTDFNNWFKITDFKYTYEPRPRGRSMLLNYSQIWL